MEEDLVRLSSQPESPPGTNSSLDEPMGSPPSFLSATTSLESTRQVDDDVPMSAPLDRMAEEVLLASAGVPEPPAPDYFHKVGSPLISWTDLEPGLEVDEEGELLWTIKNWEEISAMEKVDSPTSVVLGGFKWYSKTPIMLSYF